MPDQEPSRRRRKLSAIMMADVSGFSRLMETNEDATVDRIQEFHRRVRALVDQHEGRVVDTAGDSVFGEFDSVVNAVRCARHIQEDLAANNSEHPEKPQISTRIGVHLGDVIVENYQVYGDGVNIAARLEPLADPGGICISEAVYQQIRNKLDLPLQDLGVRTLKNIEHPIRLYKIPPPQLLDGDEPPPAPAHHGEPVAPTPAAPPAPPTAPATAAPEEPAPDLREVGRNLRREAQRAAQAIRAEAREAARRVKAEAKGQQHAAAEAARQTGERAIGTASEAVGSAMHTAADATERVLRGALGTSAAGPATDDQPPPQPLDTVLGSWLDDVVRAGTLIPLIVGIALLVSPILLFSTGGVFPTGGAILLSVILGRVWAKRADRPGNFLLALGIGIASGAVWTNWSGVTNGLFILAGLIVAAPGVSGRRHRTGRDGARAQRREQQREQRDQRREQRAQQREQRRDQRSERRRRHRGD